MVSRRGTRRRRSLSFAGRLTTLSLVAFAVSLLSGGYAAWSVQTLHQRQQAEYRLARLAESTLELDELQDSLRADLYARFSGLAGPSPMTEVKTRRLQQLALGFADGHDGEALRRLGAEEYTFSLRVMNLVTGSASRADLMALTAEANRLSEQLDDQRTDLARRRADGEAAQASASLVIVGKLAVVAFGSAVLLFSVGWYIRWGLLRSLRRLAASARALADADLTAHVGGDPDDEVGQLARILDETAAALQRAFAEREADAVRQEFRARVDRAFAQAGDEGEVTDVVRLALAEVNPTRPVELLVADSSHAHLEPMATTPGAEPPGCAVASPRSCPAVRSGRLTVYPSGEALDACPHLRRRTAEGRSAVCIPISFMGRVTGVLHATGAPGDPPDAEERYRLELIAEQTGTRLGAPQAMDQVQRQASLDGLTGLLNRRALEDSVRRLRTQTGRYAVLLADLDRFKSINDTFGHAAGDQALRQFADVVRGCIREGDFAGRIGGEEFVLIAPDMDASGGVRLGDRVRDALQEAARLASGPRVTVSVGVADSTMGSTLAEQLAVADTAMFAAKRAGRDRCVAAEPATPTTDGARVPAPRPQPADDDVTAAPGEASR